MAGEDIVELSVDPDEFARIMRELKGLDKKLATGIRKAIREGAKLVVDDVGAEIRRYPSKRSGQMREQLARSLAVRIGTAKGGTKQGVFIVSTGRLLPANKKALVKAMNRASFRHPVFPKPGSNGRSWTDQPGMRYFRQSILARRENDVRSRINDAITTATEALK